MNEPPAFQFYPDDFLAGTMHFTDAEVGLYIRLLSINWSRKGLPNDNHELSSFGKGNTSVERILPKFFVGNDGLLRNKRQEAERKKQKIYRKSRSINWKQGGRPSKPCGYHVVLKTKAKKSSPSPSPSSYSIYRIQKPSIEEVKLQCSKIGLPPAEAEKFWNYYESNGWRVGKNPMKSWPSALINWRKNYDERRYENSARNGQISRPNPRNDGVTIGPTDYAHAKPRLQRMLEAESAALAAGKTPEEAKVAGTMAVSGGKTRADGSFV